MLVPIWLQLCAGREASVVGRDTREGGGGRDTREGGGGSSLGV